MPSRHVRCRRPSPWRAARAGTPRAPAGGRARPPWASAASTRPFHDAIALSSRAGFGRCSRISNSRARVVVVELAAQDEAAVLERLEQLLGRALARRPGERQPLDAVGVGVLCRREAAAVERELAQQVVERPLGDLRGSAARRSGVRRAGRRRRAARCRRASSRSAARASARRPSSGGSRRRRGRTSRRAPSRRACGASSPPRRDGAGTRAPARAGTSARRPHPPHCGSKLCAERALRVREQRVGERLARRRQVRARADVLGQVARLTCRPRCAGRATPPRRRAAPA